MVDVDVDDASDGAAGSGLTLSGLKSNIAFFFFSPLLFSPLLPFKMLLAGVAEEGGGAETVNSMLSPLADTSEMELPAVEFQDEEGSSG